MKSQPKESRAIIIRPRLHQAHDLPIAPLNKVEIVYVYTSGRWFGKLSAFELGARVLVPPDVDKPKKGEIKFYISQTLKKKKKDIVYVHTSGRCSGKLSAFGLGAKVLGPAVVDKKKKKKHNIYHYLWILDLQLLY